jgi:hypothetical protein
LRLKKNIVKKAAVRYRRRFFCFTDFKCSICSVWCFNVIVFKLDVFVYYQRELVIGHLLIV